MKNDAKSGKTASSQQWDDDRPRTIDDLIGNGKAIQIVKQQIARFAGDPMHRPILITGERGTGKEIVAEAIYNHPFYVTHKKDFLVINSGTLQGETPVSQLFGYKKGAFTGAVSDSKGIMATYHGGTVFLDEIGNLSLSGQQLFHRAIQAGRALQVGGLSEQKFSIRLIFATNRDLKDMCNKGEFMPDLRDRMMFRHIHCPALRERREDIPLLLAYLLKKYNPIFGLKKQVTISRAALKRLMVYGFPGNVRELEDIIENAFLDLRDENKFVIGINHLLLESEPETAEIATEDDGPDELMQFINRIVEKRVSENKESWEKRPVEEIKPLFDMPGYKRHIKNKVYELTGNKAKAARLLNLSRHQFDSIE
jgi:DNA-binding NtrC family response regulator